MPVHYEINKPVYRRRYRKHSQFYMTTRQQQDIEMAKARRSFKRPQSDKLVSYIKYSDQRDKMFANRQLKKPLYLKDSYRIAGTRDLIQRLYIPNEREQIITVVDFHPSFYTIIDGRPLRFLDDIKVYMNNIRNHAMFRQQIGYRRDIVHQIDQNFIHEKTECEGTAAALRMQVKNFQKLLAEDYQITCVKVAKAEKLHEKVEAKTIEFLKLVVDWTVLNNQLFKIEEIRNVLKTYREFLMYAAPTSWKKQFYYASTAGRISSFYIEEGKFITSSEEYIGQNNEAIECPDTDEIMANALIELRHPAPAHLYFKTPKEMADLFHASEVQSREYLIHLSQTQPLLRSLQNAKKYLKRITKHDSEHARYVIDNINKKIEQELSNETYFKNKFMKILNESFFDSVASVESLKLKNYIEYVFEKIFGKTEEGHQSIYEPMTILEVTYEEYNLKLDGLDFKCVNEAREHLFSQDLNMMKAAKKAQRELKLFDEMRDSMKKAFYPPATFNRPVLGKFMTKEALKAQALEERRRQALARGERIDRKEYKLTDEERNNLIYFTSWCEGDDPAPYLRHIKTYVEPVFRMKDVDWRKSMMATFKYPKSKSQH